MRSCAASEFPLHDEVGSDSGYFELFADNLKGVVSVKLKGGFAGVAPKIVATGAKDVVTASIQQFSAQTFPLNMWRYGHAP